MRRGWGYRSPLGASHSVHFLLRLVKIVLRSILAFYFHYSFPYNELYVFFGNRAFI